MRRLKHPYALAFVHAPVFILLLAGTLAGCAAYKKCGFGGCPGDAKITAEVQALFDEHPALEPPTLLHVQTLDRVVYLTGLVDTDLERQMAESVALQAAGVARVVNSIGISGNR
jgi:osmotically-inducible protein OsmY